MPIRKFNLSSQSYPLINMDESETPFQNRNLDEAENPAPPSYLDGEDGPTPIISTKPETCVGLCSNPFKARLVNHKTSFKYESKSKSTALSTHIWDLKMKKIIYKMEWKIFHREQQYSPRTGFCSLCTCEKFQILFNQETAT